jgi:microcystin-dependent protein
MSQPYVGQLSMFAGNFAPAGWAFCAGQLLPISENDVLFQLIGTTYGGDGQSTFALPNLQSRIPVHMGQGGGLSNYTIGQSGGTESVTLNVQQIPQHNHLATTVTPTPANSDTPANNTILADEQVGLGASSPFTYAPFNSGAPNQVTLAGNTVANTGGGQPHNNIQPILAINFIISLFGIFPTPT